MKADDIRNQPVMGEVYRLADLNDLQGSCIDDCAKWLREIAAQAAEFNQTFAEFVRLYGKSKSEVSNLDVRSGDGAAGGS